MVYYIFDPTSTDTSVAVPQRFWRFLAFRSPADPYSIAELMTILAIPDDEATAEQAALKQQILDSPIREPPDWSICTDFEPGTAVFATFHTHRLSDVGCYRQARLPRPSGSVDRTLGASLADIGEPRRALDAVRSTARAGRTELYQSPSPRLLERRRSAVYRAVAQHRA